jgi:hypothetical protein
MLDLGLVANLATSGAVVTGVAFGLWQIREERKKRQELAAVELVRSFQTPHFVRAASLVMELPLGLSAADLEARGPEAQFAIMDAHMAFETLGLLVYKRVIPLDLVGDLMGGFAGASWARTHAYFEHLRAATGSAKWAEWHEWLVDRLQENMPPTAHQGAHVLHKDWRP